MNEHKENKGKSGDILDPTKSRYNSRGVEICSLFHIMHDFD